MNLCASVIRRGRQPVSGGSMPSAERAAWAGDGGGGTASLENLGLSGWELLIRPWSASGRRNHTLRVTPVHPRRPEAGR
jgi:hypothetical protein